MPRPQRAFPIAGTVLALVGLVLLVVEVVRVVNGNTLGTLGAVLLWVGVGLVAIGMLLLAWTLLGLPSGGETSYAAAPTDFDDDTTAAEPAPPRKTVAPSTPPAAPAPAPAPAPASAPGEDAELGGEA